MSNETKHTPGPWVAQREETEDSEKYVIDASGGGYTVCVAVTICGRGEDEANASLIAAAPELLSACEHAVTLLSPFEDAGLSLGLGPDALYPIKSAIVKAKGGKND